MEKRPNDRVHATGPDGSRDSDLALEKGPAVKKMSVMKKLKQELEQMFVFTCLCIIISGFGTAAYWWIFPLKVVTIYPNGPSAVVKLNGKAFYPGDVITWDFDVYQHTNGVLVTVTRQIVDGIVIQSAPVSYVTVRGRMHARSTSLVLPLFTPPGKHYHIEMAGVFHLNPLRDYTVQRITEEFEVLPSKMFEGVKVPPTRDSLEIPPAPSNTIRP